MKTRAKGVTFYILSFAIPATIILIALAGLGIAPFGNKTLLISDGDGLYINFLSYVGRVVEGKEGVLYSFEKGLGANMMDSWGWFLLNPFFTLFSLFDITGYPTAFTYVSVLNFSICGLTMYILLKDLYGHKLSNLIFSSSYALNGFLVANVFQMNFFTGVFALPLMVLGLRKILQNRNPILYILSLAYSLFTNFYFGFMLSVASFCFFVVIFVVEGKAMEHRKYKTVKYIISSICAGLISSVIWFPAILALRGGRLDQTSIASFSFKEKMPFLEIAAKLFTGANSTAQLEDGLPNIFVGILPVMLTILFFLNKKIERKKKIEAGVLLGIYLISFYIIAFDMLMHGGTVTNWFNFRYSFVFCFLVLMMAAYEWKFVMDEPLSNLKKAAVMMLLAAIVVFSKKYEFVNGGEVLLDFVLLAIIFLACWMHRRDPIKNTRRSLELVVMVLVSVNLFLNYRISTKNIIEWGPVASEYIETVMPVSALVDAVKATDEDFYRMEIGEQRSGSLGNDPMLYGYYGVGHGGSDDKNATRTALSKLGIHRYDMRNYYGKGVPAATDALLGLKYVISKENLVEEKGYEELPGLIDWGLYRNDMALPIAVIVNNEISDLELNFDDLFENLNQTWSSISGCDDGVFIEETDIHFESHNYVDSISISHDEAEKIVSGRDTETKTILTEHLSGLDGDQQLTLQKSEMDSIMNNDDSKLKIGSLKTPPEDASYIMYTWVAKQDGPVYTYNRSGMADRIGSVTPALNYEGYYHKGDVVTGYLPIYQDYITRYVVEDVAGRFKAAYAQIDVLEKLSEIVKQRPITCERVSDGLLKGTFLVEDGEQIMFTIPYDAGWTLKIDGKLVCINKALDVFMIGKASAGTHTYEIEFFPEGLKEARTVALICVILTLAFIVFDHRIGFNKKEQKK